MIDSCRLLNDSHERRLSRLNYLGRSLVSAALFPTAVLSCSKLFLQASAVGITCAMHHVTDLVLLVLRLGGKMCVANPLLPGVGLPLFCWVKGSTVRPGRKDSI